MTSLSTSQATAEPATGTADAGRPVEDRAARIERLREAAYRIRLNALTMGEVQGQGYIGQALGVADVLAVAYADQLRYRPEDPHWAGRDRFLLSIGHYAIALYAALAEAGIIPVEELETYGSDESRLPMSGMASYTPGMEISGGSLGHGLAVATGMALGLRHQGNPARVFNLLSDGELDEGSTWEAALQCRAPRPGQRHRDRRRQRPAGRRPHRRHPAHRAGHRQVAGVRLERAAGRRQRHRRARRRVRRAHARTAARPSVLICDTRIGCGVPLLETREKAHFMRVAERRVADRPRPARRRTRHAGLNRCPPPTTPQPGTTDPRGRPGGEEEAA